jgi:hypothetical protein
MVAQLDVLLLKFDIMPATIKGTEVALNAVNAETRELSKELESIQRNKWNEAFVIPNIERQIFENMDLVDKLLLQLRELTKNKEIRVAMSYPDRILRLPKPEIEIAVSDQWKALDKAIGDVQERLNPLSKKQKEIKRLNDEHAASMKILKGIFIEMNVPIDAQTTALNHLAVEYEGVIKRIQDADLKKIIKDFSEGMAQNITDSIMAMSQGLKSFKDVVKDVFRYVMAQVIKVQVANPLANAINSALSGARGSGGFGSSIIKKLFGESFDGGGFTGTGARAGGIDNKGGFPAILHPNETVIDHSKGQSASQSNVNISFNITANDTDGFDELLESRRGMIVNLINGAMNDRGTLGVT